MPASIEDALIAFLGAAAGVTAIVGTSPPRICPAVVPQGLALPRIVVTKSGDAPTYCDVGEVGPGRAEFDIECQASTISAAEPLRDAVREVLSGYQGALGARRCSRCFVVDEFDAVHPAVHGEEKGVVGKTVSIELDYS